ncbi:MAG: hypothetical protein U0793_22095 [Gemmataceae bacterium]
MRSGLAFALLCSLGAGADAGSDEEKLFLVEINQIPWPATRPRPGPFVQSVPPAFLKALKDYPADFRTLEERQKRLAGVAKDDLRLLVVNALRLLKEQNPVGLEGGRLAAPVTKQARKAVVELQTELGVADFRLKQAAAELKAARASDNYARFSKRWQAQADLVHALVLGRLVGLHECSNALAKVRLDALPELPPGSVAWKLIPTEKLTTFETAYKRMNKERLQLLRDIAGKYQSSPWAFVAEREKDEKMGLAWVPIAAK